jgi:hypothetical protein
MHNVSHKMLTEDEELLGLNNKISQVEEKNFSNSENNFTSSQVGSLPQTPSSNEKSLSN